MIPNIPDEGKLRVFVIILYGAIALFIILFAIQYHINCINQTNSAWQCIKTHWLLYLVFLILWEISFILFFIPVSQVMKIYRVKDAYTNSLRINIALKNLKLKKELGYYKNKKEFEKELRDFFKPRKDRRKWWKKTS